MGIFNFGKKKDPLDDLSLPDSSANNTFGSHTNHDEFSDPGPEPQFENKDPVSSDPMSSGMPNSPNFDLPDYGHSDHAGDQYAKYQQAVQSSPDSFHTNNQNTNSSFESKRDSVDHSTELVLSKLDVLKAMIENLGHRIENLEQKYERDKEERKKSW